MNLKQIRDFFTIGARLYVKRPGKKVYSGIIRDCLIDVVFLERRRSTKIVAILTLGKYTVGNRSVIVRAAKVKVRKS